jgi:hypothetical protein
LTLLCLTVLGRVKSTDLIKELAKDGWKDRRILRLLDAKAKANGESRSGFIAHLALAAD